MKTIRFLLLTAILISWAHYSIAGWQELLSSEYDIASTFDDLDDWKGSAAVNTVDIQSYPQDFPVTSIDASPSIWQYYSIYDDVGALNWIQNHGINNVWRGTGKSMRLDYSNGADGISYGPSRIGLKIGDSPDDGYEEIYVFFMTKWETDFFKLTGDSFNYHRFLKTLDISAGFTDVRYFGTPQEHEWLKSNGAATQVLHEYGINAQVYNYYSYGSVPRKEVIKNTILTTDSSNISYDHAEHIYSDLDVGKHILADQWFGVEYRVKMSNPHGADNGEFEIWIYDNEGVISSHFLATGQVNFRDGNTPFNHKWNKIVWGGNRFAGSYCPGADPLCDFGPTDHFYLDDVIIHGSRIGLKYFSLLNDQMVTINFAGEHSYIIGPGTYKYPEVRSIRLPKHGETVFSGSCQSGYDTFHWDQCPQILNDGNCMVFADKDISIEGSCRIRTMHLPLHVPTLIREKTVQ